MAGNQWQEAPAALAAARGEVHVWRAALEGGAQGLEDLLSADERERADRFHFAEHRQRFVQARSTLRQLLGRYLGVGAQEVEFSYGEQGKPFLEGAELCFNASHSHLLALYAVSRGREVGVDVEYPRPRVAVENIAARFFSRGEVEALLALPPEQQRQAFFHIWTRKEAYLKARGAGITSGLDRFSVSLEPGRAALLECLDDRAERWGLAELDAGPGYVAAVCALGRDWALRCFEWG